MSRLPSTLFLIALMVASLVMFSTVQFGGAQTSGTNVTGIISADTTWTVANSPYNLVGNMLVSSGVTLTIQPGVTVNISSFFLRVDGSLDARGTPDNRIIINVGTSTSYDAGIEFENNSAWNSQTHTGSIIQYATITSNRVYYPTIKLEYASPTIDNNVINCISYNTGIECWYGGSPVISNNVIYGDVLSHCYNGGHAIIINNIITNPGAIALNIGGNVTASNNTLCNSNQGILCHDLGDNDNFVVLMLGNLIINNSIGIRVFQGDSVDSPTAQYVIENNTIANNGQGIFLDSEHTLHQIANGPTIQGNSIFNNTQYNLQTTYYTDTNAAYNWWGATNTQAINQTIYDFKNDFTLGKVTFTPFLSASNTAAPLYITTIAGNGGSITPSGYISVSYGGSKTLNVAAVTGYHVVDVRVNGTSVGVVSSYTVQDVTGETMVLASFAVGSAPSPTPTPTPTPSPKSTTSPTPTATPTSTPCPTQTATPASTVKATTNGGSTIEITVNGNVTTAQMSNVTITSNQSTATTTISLTLTGQSGTVGFSNITIAKNAVPYGNTPIIYVDGKPASNQGCTQDTSNYYVWYTTHFSKHQVSIVFTAASTSPSASKNPSGSNGQLNYLDFAYGIASGIAIVAVVLVALKVAMRNRKPNAN